VHSHSNIKAIESLYASIEKNPLNRALNSVFLFLWERKKPCVREERKRKGSVCWEKNVMHRVLGGSKSYYGTFSVDICCIEEKKAKRTLTVFSPQRTLKYFYGK
jgi:hypothetical protein